MPLWLVVTILLMLGSIVEIFLALRLDLAPAPRRLLIVAAVATPLIVLAIFRFVMPEAAATPIF